MNPLTWGMTFGINPTPPNHGNLYKHWDKLIPDVKRLGLTRIRFQLSWNCIEFPQGTYFWNILDDAVHHITSNNLEMVFPIRGAPTWALTTPSQQTTTEPFYAPDPTLMAGFCQQVVNRYGNSINYEISNEDFNIHNTSPQDGTIFGINNSPWALYNGLAGVQNQIQPARDPFFYEPCAAACYPVLKSKGSRVGMAAMYWMQPTNVGGIPNTPVSNFHAFLTQLFADGYMQYADYVNLHYYSDTTDPSIGSHQVISFGNMLSDISAVLATYSSPLKLRVTEWGWGVPNAVPDYQTQLNRYKYVIGQALNSPIMEGSDFFTLNYDVGGSPLSLVTANSDGTFTYQPSFFLVQQYAASGSVYTNTNDNTSQGTPLYGQTDRPIYNMAAMYRRAPKRGGLLESIGADIARLQGWIEDHL